MKRSNIPKSDNIVTHRPKTFEDFTLEPPSSLREVVKEEMVSIGYDDLRRGKPVKPITDKAIDELMLSIFAHIEKQALATYHSAEPWALRQWALSNIFREAIADEATNEIAHGLISPIIQWQAGQEFDPLALLLDNLHRKSYRTKISYKATVSRFIGMVGRRKSYSDTEVADYLKHFGDKYQNDNTYYQECSKLLIFLKMLPGADKARELPKSVRPDKPRRFYTPSASLEDIETIIWSCVLDNIDYSMVVRLICATVYGRRRSELSELDGSAVHLNGKNSTILFQTKKRGEEDKPHPIPEALVPLFRVPIKRMDGYSLQRKLQTICKNAGVKLPSRAGYHWFRRRVATVVRKVSHSDIDTHNFMRWAIPRELTILDRYDQTTHQETDTMILENHPIVKIWEQAVPYILEYNKSYRLMNDNIFYNVSGRNFQ